MQSTKREMMHREAQWMEDYNMCKVGPGKTVEWAQGMDRFTDQLVQDILFTMQ